MVAEPETFAARLVEAVLVGALEELGLGGFVDLVAAIGARCHYFRITAISFHETKQSYRAHQPAQPPYSRLPASLAPTQQTTVCGQRRTRAISAISSLR